MVTQVGGEGSWRQSRSIRSGTKWSESQSVLKIEQYFLTDWMWVWEKEASKMAGGLGPLQWEDGVGIHWERQQVKRVCMRRTGAQ